MFSLRFWGVRGSISVANENARIYGGHTTCLEIRAGSRLIIIDAGTGLCAQGEQLFADRRKAGRENEPIQADVFISHTHFDHMTGFILYPPFFNPANTFYVHGPKTAQGISIKEMLYSLFSREFWPIGIDQLRAKLLWNSIGESTSDIGDNITVRSIFLNHTCPCLGYRIEYEGKCIVTLFDHEAAVGGDNARAAAFIKDADIAVMDAQYTRQEYENGKQGWGHSSYEAVIEIAQRAGVKTAIAFHHDPARTDAELEKLEKQYQPSGKSLRLLAAREGMVFEL
jgi:phosphoribosyl 1,2-cyclic phosphodiesterase